MTSLLLISMLTFATWQDTSFVSVRAYAPGIIHDVRYATANNFTKRILYPNDSLRLRRDVALALADAERRVARDGYRIKIFDAYRPVSVQRALWAIVPDERYVADPAKGSRHNRGCAVDITLCDAAGNELDFGTPYDDFTERAHAAYTNLPDDVLARRRYLQHVMSEAGFDVLPTEWWHFDFRGWERYGIPEE